jgi:DNA-binding protein HU-beta
VGINRAEGSDCLDTGGWCATRYQAELGPIEVDGCAPFAPNRVTSRFVCGLCRKVLTGRTSKLKTSELIDHVATAAGLDVRTAKKAVDAVFAGIVAAAKKGEEVSLPSFGKFKVKDSAARQGRNPGTGQTIEIAASRKLGFSPAKQVKDVLAA